MALDVIVRDSTTGKELGRASVSGNTTHESAAFRFVRHEYAKLGAARARRGEIIEHRADGFSYVLEVGTGFGNNFQRAGEYRVDVTRVSPNREKPFKLESTRFGL